DDAVYGDKADDDQPDTIARLRGLSLADALERVVTRYRRAAAAPRRQVRATFQHHDARKKRHQRLTDPVEIASRGTPPRGIGTGIPFGGAAFRAASTPLMAAATSPPALAINSSIVVSGIGSCDRGMGSSTGMAS